VLRFGSALQLSLALGGLGSLLGRPVVGLAEGRAGFAAAYWRPETFRVEGELRGTLYQSLAAAIPDSLLSARERATMAWQIADVFRWEADFTRDIRQGDHFRFLFERLVSPIGEVRYGRLLAADLTVGGRVLRAYEFDDAEGGTAFYDDQGASLRRNFLRVPVEFRRISSPFSAGRFHPILHRWRKHEGIDYAAQPGTPVMVVGDGVVLRVGTFGGYGKLVEVRHADGVVTRYGHLSRFATGLRPGSRVSQGQCIGYVGATGLATGPHLHYEFRVNGVATDPALLPTEEATPVTTESRAMFEQSVERLSMLLEAMPVELAHQPS